MDRSYQVALIYSAVLIFGLCVPISAYAKCLAAPEQYPHCRYPAGDSWCAQNSNYAYAFDDACLSKVQNTSSISKDDAIYWDVLENLSCTAKPDATYFLLYLERQKIIEPKEAIGWDSLSCFPTKQLEIEGLPVSFVCATTENAAVMELFPQFYWRGPGTHPGVFMSLISPLGTEELTEWLRQKDIQGSPKVSQSNYTNLLGKEARSEIRCSSWMVKN